MEKIFKKIVDRLTNSGIEFTITGDCAGYYININQPTTSGIECTITEDYAGYYININQPTTSGEVTRVVIHLNFTGLYFVRYFYTDGQTDCEMFTSLKTVKGRLELRDGSIEVLSIQ